MAATTEIKFCKHYTIYGTKVFHNIQYTPSGGTTQLALCTLSEIRNWFGNQNIQIHNILVSVNNCDANIYNIRPTYTPVIWRNGNVTVNLAFGTGITVGSYGKCDYRINFTVFWFPIESEYVVI